MNEGVNAGVYFGDLIIQLIALGVPIFFIAIFLLFGVLQKRAKNN